MVKLSIFLILILCLETFAEEKNPCTHDETTLRCVEYLRNYDADTITFNIPGLHPLLGKKISIRVNGVDTPEIKPKKKGRAPAQISCEKDLAKVARDKVGNLLKNAKRIDLESISRGKYFRIVANVKIDGKDLTEYLLEEKLAYPYDGGTKSNVDWCKRLPASK